MEQPLVSIVVVSYNQGKYIKENLDSVKAQTYTNWELIVADDASNDDSVAEFKNWLTSNSVPGKEIFHTKNTGLATVLNEAIDLCSGKYVKLIAADDFMHPECLEKSVKCLEDKGENYGMVFTDTFCVDDNSNSLPDIANYDKLGNIPPKEFRRELLKGNRIAALTVLLRKKAVLETGQYDSKFLVEDYYRWLKINEKYLIAYLPEKLSYYRLHAENISKTKAERIEIETYILQIMFDHKGIVKDKINNFMQSRYLLKKEIPKDLLSSFLKYPFGMKRLKPFIKYNLPQFAYHILCKFI